MKSAKYAYNLYFILFIRLAPAEFSTFLIGVAVLSTGPFPLVLIIEIIVNVLSSSGFPLLNNIAYVASYI